QIPCRSDRGWCRHSVADDRGHRNGKDPDRQTPEVRRLLRPGTPRCSAGRCRKTARCPMVGVGSTRCRHIRTLSLTVPAVQRRLTHEPHRCRRMRAIRLVRTVAVLAVALVVGAAIPTAAAQQSHPLTLAARAWGLAKYFHPGVTSCAVDWDQALMDALPALEAAGTDVEARSQALMALLDAAGAHGAEEPTAGTPQWIRDAAVTAPLRARLAWLAAQQPHQQCYVQRTLAADFSTDAGHAIAAPDRAHRALAAFRFWNAIEYFFPYKADIGRDWAGILDQTLDPVLDAPDFGAYVRAMR